MTTSETGEKTIHRQPPRVPVGGAGTGYLEVGVDGRISRIAINNTREPSEAVPGLNSFAAVRARTSEGIAIRLLQNCPVQCLVDAGIEAPHCAAHQMEWQGMFPAARFQLNEPAFPLELFWIYLAPALPYDVDASTMPVVFLQIEAVNHGKEPIEFSALWNWENCSGAVGTYLPEVRGVMEPLSPETPEVGQKEDAVIEDMPPMGIRMGVFKGKRGPHEGDFCLAAACDDDCTIGVMSWKSGDIGQTNRLWRDFSEDGLLGNILTNDESAHNAAVSTGTIIKPGQRQNLTLALTWYCPQLDDNPDGPRNGYCLAFRDSITVTRRALRFHRYYAKAITAWQRRFFGSSLPKWLSACLLQANELFTLQTLLTTDGEFRVASSGDQGDAATPLRLAGSIGSLLAYPHFSAVELDRYALSLTERGFGAGQQDATPLNAADFRGMTALILLTHRNYLMTGRLADVRKLLPLLTDVMRRLIVTWHMAARTPHLSGFPMDQIGSWLCALRMYADLASRAGQAKEAQYCDTIADQLVKVLPTLLRASQDNAAQRETLLRSIGVGQWFADFLCMGEIVPASQIPMRLVVDALLRGKLLPDQDDALTLVAGLCLEMKIGHAKRAFGILKTLCGCEPGVISPLGGLERHALWHIPLGLLGFLYNAPDKILWLRPRLPEGVHSLSAPLYSPICLGQVILQEKIEEGAYVLSAEVCFDSPIQVQAIALRLPREVAAVSIELTGPMDDGESRHNIGEDGGERLLEIRLATALTMNEPVKVRVTQTAGSQVTLS